MEISLLKGNTTQTNTAAALRRTNKKGPGFDTKPGFEVKGSGGEEDSRCQCGAKGINWGTIQSF